MNFNKIKKGNKTFVYKKMRVKRKSVFSFYRGMFFIELKFLF